MGNITPQKFEPVSDGSVEEKISQLLSAMPRVEAPGDFGFRVKARIADARPVNSRPMWLPTALKASVPLGLAVAVGGYFALTSFYVPGGPGSQQAAIQNSQPAPVPSTDQRVIPQVQARPDVSATEIPAEPSVIAAAPHRIREIPVRAAVRRTEKRSNVEDKHDSGDFDAAVSTVKDPSTSTEPVTRPETAKGTPAGEVLTRIGVNALFGDSGWKAESVTPNTAAAKAGVKAGDVIESVDDQDLTDLGSVAKPATGKKLKVKRDGKSIEIVID